MSSIKLTKAVLVAIALFQLNCASATTYQYQYPYKSNFHGDVPGNGSGETETPDPNPVDPEDPSSNNSINLSGPSESFSDEAFVLSWNKGNAVSFKIKSNDAQSGISTSETNLGAMNSAIVTASSAGSYQYTVIATDAEGKTSSSKQNVEIISEPAITNFKASSNVIASGSAYTLSWDPVPNATLSIYGIGDVTGKTSVDAIAPFRSGSMSVTLEAERTVNNITRTVYSDANFTLAQGPRMQFTNYPALTNVFAESNNYLITWYSDSAVSYKIQSDNDDSGVPSTPLTLGNVKQYSAKAPQVGSYKITVTGTNAAGISTPITLAITAVPTPWVYYFTPDRNYVSPGDMVTLTWGTKGSTNSYIYGIGAISGDYGSISVPAGDVIGQKSWTLHTGATANGQMSSEKATSVNVVADPTVQYTSTVSDNLWANDSFELQWTGTDIASYTLKGSSDGSGVSASGVSYGFNTRAVITPTESGTHTYTIIAKNMAGASKTATMTVVIK